MILPEKMGIWRQVLHKIPLYLLVTGPYRKKAQPIHDSCGISIHYKNGMPPGIEKDRINRLWTQTPDGKELFPEMSQLPLL